VLKDSLGGDLVSLRTQDGAAALEQLSARYGIGGSRDGDVVSFQVPRADEFLPGLLKSFPVPVLAVEARRPTLDDVFLTLTGRSIREDSPRGAEQLRRFVDTPGMKAQMH
jgi:ABC-2 type transport system ATP-binding protein